MKAFNDYLIVKVSAELETFAGLMKDENGNEIRLILNPNFRPTHNSKISARVISVPLHLTGKNSPLYEIGPGYPKPSSYRGATHINSILNNTPKKYRAKTIIPYRCGLYEPNMQTNKGLKVEVQPNDEVYFHYNMLLNEHNYLFRDTDGFLVYKIPYTSVFCRVRNRKITMLNSFVLVSEAPDEDVVEVEVDGRSIKGKLEDKLLVPGDRPLYLSGILRHIGEGIGPDRRDIKPDTHVMFRPSSEFVNMIEGEAFYVMRQWDIIASWFPDEEIERMKEDPRFNEIFGRNHWIHPEGDYVMVRPNNIDTGGDVVAFDQNNPDQGFTQGTIFVPGESIKDNRKGKIFSYGVGKVIDSGNLCIDGKEIYYEKGSHYVYVEDYDLAFVRTGDIYGEYLRSPEADMEIAQR